MKLHQEFLARGKEPADVLFLGDSITAGWKGTGAKEIFAANFDKYHAANFGIGGDRTQHVIWRIENGELDNIKPKVTVLMIGTNNLSTDAPDKIADGVEKIVKEIREKTGSKVLLLAIFPRGEKPDAEQTKMLRGKIAVINEKLQTLDDGKNIKYLDIGDKFLEPDGTIKPTIMKDFLHLTKEGYQREADAIGPVIEEMVK